MKCIHSVLQTVELDSVGIGATVQYVQMRVGGDSRELYHCITSFSLCVMRYALCIMQTSVLADIVTAGLRPARK